MNDGFDINDRLAEEAQWDLENKQRVADAWANYSSKRKEHYDSICPTCHGTGQV